MIPYAYVYVLDTNTLIDYPNSIFAFQNCTLVIPLTTISEIDGLKERDDIVGKNAKKINSILAEIQSKGALSKGVEINNNGYIVVEKSHKECLPEDFPISKPDNKILSVALYYQKNNVIVTIITNDNNLKIKANSLDILALSYEEYQNKNTEKNDIEENHNNRKKNKKKTENIDEDDNIEESIDYEFEIDSNTCVGCGACEATCPVNAIETITPLFSSTTYRIINKDICVQCGACIRGCPVVAIS